MFVLLIFTLPFGYYVVLYLLLLLLLLKLLINQSSAIKEIFRQESGLYFPKQVFIKQSRKSTFYV
jgi:hypothetical protein